MSEVVQVPMTSRDEDYQDIRSNLPAILAKCLYDPKFTCSFETGMCI